MFNIKCAMFIVKCLLFNFIIMQKNKVNDHGTGHKLPLLLLASFSLAVFANPSPYISLFLDAIASLDVFG